MGSARVGSPIRSCQRSTAISGDQGGAANGRPEFSHLGAQNRSAIIVGVEVGKQAETGRRTDFERGQRLGKSG
jgi:hypothetical protein